MKEQLEIENKKEFLPEQEQLQTEFKQELENETAQAEQQEGQENDNTQLPVKQEPTNRLYDLQRLMIIPIVEGKISFEKKENGKIEYSDAELDILEKASNNIEGRHPNKMLNNDFLDIASIILIHAPKLYLKFKDKIKNKVDKNDTN